jgi:hypothetical protein
VVEPGKAELQAQSARWRDAYSATAGLPFDDRELEEQLVWIWGSSRTGSTWLTRLICDPADPDPEAPLGFTAPADAGPLAAVPFNEFLIAAHIAPKSGPPGEAEGVGLMPATPNLYLHGFNSYVFADRFADVWGPELRRLTLVRIAAALDRARELDIALADRPLAIVKEVNATHAADVVMPLFRRSRMIFLHRDGRDVIDSRIHAHGQRGWMVGKHGPRFKTPAERLEWVREECLEWACGIDVATAAFERHPPELRYELRYEDLRAAPAATLGELRRWLGISSSEPALAGIVERHSFERIPESERGARKSKRAARPGLWRENLTREEQAAATEIMGPRLARLGYPQR